jgi:excisionase family DNA binding protein
MANERDREHRPAPLLTAGEVAQIFRVSPKTVARWGRSGRLPMFRTPGGDQRYRLPDIEAFFDREPEASDA